MAVVVDDGITLTLRNGDTVTLYERNISVAERRDIRTRAIALSSEIEFKTKQAARIDKKCEEIEADESLNGDREAMLTKFAQEGAELLASVDLIEVRVDTLSRRFASWDVFATQADKDANNPVELTKEALLAFCEKPKRAALIVEIIDKLAEYDKGEEKKDLSAPADGGKPSIATVA